MTGRSSTVSAGGVLRGVTMAAGCAAAAAALNPPPPRLGTASVSSGVAGAEYQMDDGPWQSLALADPAAGLYATLFTPTDADEGPHTLSFRASDHAGNTSSPVFVSIFIESFKAFKELTGTLAATPDPVMQGTEVTFVYSVTNSYWDGISGLVIVVEVIDPIALQYAVQDYTEQIFNVLVGFG